MVPNYLSAMPSDPFAGDGRCLGYLADAPEPALYSVGDDGEDDGGDFSRPSGVMRLTKDIPFYLDGKPGDLGQEATAPGPAER